MGSTSIWNTFWHARYLQTVRYTIWVSAVELPLANSMQQSPSWEASSSSASQEIPHILRHTKVH